MPIKPSFDISTTWQPLPNHHVLVIDGPDALAFTQSQFMNDVKLLAIGHWQWNGWLSAKGRLLALFALLRAAENTFLAVIADLPADELAQELKRFVFRSKIRIEKSDNYHVIGCFETLNLDPSQRHIALRVQEDWLLDMSGDQTARTLAIISRQSANNSTLYTEDIENFDAQWFEQDIRHGLPRIDASQRDQWTPQMLSLERLGAFSLRKGCYPGQEIVARTHYLGKVKRSLGLIQSNEKMFAGQIIHTQQNGNNFDYATAITNSTMNGFFLAVINHADNPVLPDQLPELRAISTFSGLIRAHDLQSNLRDTK